MNDLRKALNVLLAAFVSTYLVVLLLAVSVFFVLSYYNHERLADSFARSVRNSVVIHDLREAIMILNPAVGQSFDGVELQTQNKMVFALPSLPETNEIKQGFFTIGIARPVLENPDSSKSGEVGALIFYYNSSRALALAGASWLVLLLFSFPMFRWARNYVERRHKELLAQKAAESAAEVAKQVAHDIRAPVSALNILAARSSMRDSERSLLSQSIQRISQIADDLLAKERSKAAVKSVSIVKVVSEIVNEKRLALNSDLKQLKLQNETDGDARALADETLLSRIISNLINNAVEAIQSEGTIDVVISHVDSMVEIAIVDSGVGIPPDVLTRIGQPGYTTKSEGSGLGLYMAIKAAKAWGGDLVIESKMGRGSRVSLKLPSAPASSY